jgi:hypothetical protein
LIESDKGNLQPRRWIALVYVALLALVVPWYWPAADSRHFLGFPLWAIATLVAVLATSIFTAWVNLSLPDDEPD